MEQNNNNEKGPEKRRYNSFLDQKRIIDRQEEYDLSDSEAAELIGIKESQYQRIKNKRPPEKDTHQHPLHSVEIFFKLAEKFNFDPIDIVKPDCPFRKKLFSVSLKMFKNEEDFNKHLLEYDLKYGRLAVFNTFPSSIYYLVDVKSSQERYKFLGNASLSDFSKLKIRNTEYYPITSVLEFALNPFHRFKLEEKGKILNKMIDSFSRDLLGHERRILRIFDPDEKDYYHDAPTCTILRNINTGLMPSPTDKNHLLILKSDELIEKMVNYGDLDTKTAIDTTECVDLLEIIKCYILDQNIGSFLKRLNEETSKRVKAMVNGNLNKFAPHLIQNKP